MWNISASHTHMHTHLSPLSEARARTIPPLTATTCSRCGRSTGAYQGRGRPSCRLDGPTPKTRISRHIGLGVHCISLGWSLILAVVQMGRRPPSLGVAAARHGDFALGSPVLYRVVLSDGGAANLIA